MFLEDIAAGPSGKTVTYQAPKGTRDFFPAELANLRHIESAWRKVAINAGFDEIEGPTFEHLELYTVKSGESIVNELFSFKRSGGKTDYALRPEFTPTLARMATSKGRSLSLPTKWFAIPHHFRAERPQRGRLREHKQWNVDLLGIDNPSADAEVIATAIAALIELGLTSQDVVVRISHRSVVASLLKAKGVTDHNLNQALAFLDKKEKMEPSAFNEKVSEAGLPLEAFEVLNSSKNIEHDELTTLQEELERWAIQDWCVFDFNIVRGLDYYTGIVFEIHERSGNERAIAGGGRYDKLVETFGGPSIPAVGFGMGDVVLGLVLKDKNLLEDGTQLLPKPCVFVVSACDLGDTKIASIVALLRASGIHARQSYKTTHNVGKLLTEATKAQAKYAVILGEELQSNRLLVKNLNTGEQEEVSPNDLLSHLS